MKVLLLNGSPHTDGCTYTALTQVADELESSGIQTEIVQLGARALRGCAGCGSCRGGNGCIFGDSDGLNEFVRKADEADGFVFGSPVHYASIAGSLSAFLDRCFFSGSRAFAFKPGAAVVSLRRAGSTVSLDQLNKYFTINNMPVVSSSYWNMVHGNTPQEVLADKEGIRILHDLGHNMAWLLKSIEAGKDAGIVH